MRKCGVCQSQVHIAFNMFEEYVGTPPVLLSKILIKCTRGTKRKYIRGGVCQTCIYDLTLYYEALQTAKRIKNKILEHIEKNIDCEIASVPQIKNHVANVKSINDCEKFIKLKQDAESQDIVIESNETISENHSNVSDIEETIFEVLEPLPNNNNICEDKYDTEEIEADYMISADDDDDDDENNATDPDTEDEGEEIGPTCNECGEHFPDYRSCKLHKAKIHPKRYVCQLCGKVLSTATGLKKHIKLHNPEKPLSCSVCGKRYHFEVDLRNHEAWHTGERPFECPECGKRFANFSSLSCHKITHKPLPENITCEVCGKKFRKPSRLRAHQLTHATVKNYACPYCKYCTANKISLNWHLKNNKKCSVIHQMDAVLVQEN